MTNSGGNTGKGGNTGVQGGNPQSGGLVSTGGKAGNSNAGGNSSTGGSSLTGGTTANGGGTSAGGMTTAGGSPAAGGEIGLYRTFERAVENTKSYSNKFTEVELKVSYTSPSGKKIDFWGFFDGDGKGGGNATSGSVWKMRFMPDELGPWKYTWTFSDGSPGGEGVFTSVTAGAGKGILRAYKDNPRWFAYNGTQPVYLKSYYETGHGAIAQPFDWITTNVYQPMLDHGYNHLQVNWLLPLCCEEQFYTDGPAQSTKAIRLYSEGKASSTMNFNVWKMMETHVQWLNDRNVGLHMFLGFDGSRNDGPSWTALSASEKDFYVRYVVARLGPYANIAGWNYVWEVSGSSEAGELGLAKLLAKYDVFNHLRTYEDETPKSNEYQRPEYTFAAIENHGFGERLTSWRAAYSHHEASLAGYVTGKPVYMSEGNALWRRYWAKKTGATQDDLRQAAWACVTGGASFNWNGHAAEEGLTAKGAEGLPFNNQANPYTASTKHLDILAKVMNEEVTFYRMNPNDALLSGHDKTGVWCLAEPGKQYVVFATKGGSFTLDLAAGEYTKNMWMDAKTGDSQPVPTVSGSIKFTPPNTTTDWVLIVRT
jgi:hypothetical protein